MTTRLSSLSVVGALVVASSLAMGCAGTRAEGTRAEAVGTAATTGAAVDSREARANDGHATASLALAVRSEEDDSDDTPRGIVVVDADVIQSCESVRAVRGKVKREDTMAWLHILKSVARCMNDGELRARHLVLHGPTRPQVIVKYMLSKLGVTEDRVDLTTVPGASTCNDDCDPSEMRVDIGIAGAGTAVSQAL